MAPTCFQLRDILLGKIDHVSSPMAMNVKVQDKSDIESKSWLPDNGASYHLACDSCDSS